MANRDPSVGRTLEHNMLKRLGRQLHSIAISDLGRAWRRWSTAMRSVETRASCHAIGMAHIAKLLRRSQPKRLARGMAALRRSVIGARDEANRITLCDRATARIVGTWRTARLRPSWGLWRRVLRDAAETKAHSDALVGRMLTAGFGRLRAAVVMAFARWAGQV